MNKEIRELLKEIEWGENEVCFICKATISQGHLLNCNMGKALALLDKPADNPDKKKNSHCFDLTSPEKPFKLKCHKCGRKFLGPIEAGDTPCKPADKPCTKWLHTECDEYVKSSGKCGIKVHYRYNDYCEKKDCPRRKGTGKEPADNWPPQLEQVNQLRTQIKELEEEATCEECEKTLIDKESGLMGFCIECWNRSLTKLHNQIKELKEKNKWIPVDEKWETNIGDYILYYWVHYNKEKTKKVIEIACFKQLENTEEFLWGSGRFGHPSQSFAKYKCKISMPITLPESEDEKDSNSYDTGFENEYNPA